jgi:hypothetical protein
VGKHVRLPALGVSVLAVHAATWAVAARLGAAVGAVEILLAVTVVLTALFAPDKFSDRAFRLLRRDVSKTARGGRRAGSGALDMAEVREWARAQGIEVKDRGRVADGVIARFRAGRPPGGRRGPLPVGVGWLARLSTASAA